MRVISSGGTESRRAMLTALLASSLASFFGAMDALSDGSTHTLAMCDHIQASITAMTYELQEL